MSATHGPCPIDGCTLALVQIDGLHLSPMCPAHGSPCSTCEHWDSCPRHPRDAAEDDRPDAILAVLGGDPHSWPVADTYEEVVAVVKRELDLIVEGADWQDARDIADHLGTRGLLSVPFPPGGAA